MTRNRIFGFLVILACLLVAPLMFADHDHDKEVDAVHRMSEHPDAVARQRAYEHAREERLRFERHSAPVFLPAYRLILTRVRIVPTTYYYRRAVFYEEYGWRPPVYVYTFDPRYGVWDAVFLAFALDHVADDEYALMFYHHRREAEMESWLVDNRRLAAENEELRIRLHLLDERVAQLEKSGVATDSGYVPPDAQDVALSPEVIDKLTASK